MTDYIEAATKDEWFARAMRAEERLREARDALQWAQAHMARVGLHSTAVDAFLEKSQ